MQSVWALALGVSMAILPFTSTVSVAQAAGSQEVTASSTDLNQQARQLLDKALATNGLIGPDVKPWHLKVDFRMHINFHDGPKSLNGSMEQWYASPNRWRRNYRSEWPSWNGSEWSVSKIDRFTKKEGKKDLEDYTLMRQIARPLTDPLYQAAHIKPTDELVVKTLDLDGLALNCVSLSEKSAGERGPQPEWQVPMMCFDDKAHLRVIRSEKTLLYFNDVQMFEGRAVARGIEIVYPHEPPNEIAVTVLEPAGNLDDALLTPPSDAVARPYVIERGMPKPVSVYEVGAHISWPPNIQHFSSLLVPVFIQKDGTVKLQRDVGDDNPIASVFKAAYKAVAKWKFQPYLVDGRPVVADYYVPYPLNEQPFVPSYQRKRGPGDDVAGDHPGF